MPATQILVIGDQGTGKSSAWASMNPEETLIITPNAKPFPWEGSAKQYVIGKNRVQTKELSAIPALLEKINKERLNVKTVLVDDLTHFFNARTTSPAFVARRLGNDAYAKWGELANDVARCIDLGETFRDDLTIVYNGHTEMNDEGLVAMLTPGKLLDRDIKVPSYFTYVFHSLVVKNEKDIEYKFLTNKDGRHDAKTPRGCFTQLLIDNDMKMIIDRIRKYQSGE